MSYENKQVCKLTLQILVRGTAPYRKYNGQLHLAQKLNKRTKQWNQLFPPVRGQEEERKAFFCQYLLS